jgi:glycosyltransferase involved in cell wall biosynthesis
MRICHVTPHLPPDQAANALLPYHLGQWARADGHVVDYVAHPPRMGGRGPRPALSATYIPSRHDRPRWMRRTKLASVVETARILRVAGPVLARADLVHVHGNGLLPEMAGWVAARRGKPVVLTLYGTEIWHYRRHKGLANLFTRLYRAATRVTFYSQGLLDRAREHGLDRPGLSVIYPPVSDEFTFRDALTQGVLRDRLHVRNRHLLVNVKRLHPLAGQRYLIEALPLVLKAHPDTRLVVCGTGPLADQLSALAQALGVSQHVVFTGLVDNSVVAQYCAAADLFVLPSLLEACPTVALEALASGTPVVSADHPGGVELHALFGDDVTVVPREQPGPLAMAIIRGLEHKRRTRRDTRDVLAREFRPAVVWSRFLTTYHKALSDRGREVPSS